MRGLCIAIPLLAAAIAAQSAFAEDTAPTVSAAESLFVEKCGLCHLEGGFGTRVLQRRVPDGQALLQDRAALPATFTTAVVRQGIGSMPQLREAELTDAQLAEIASYLEAGQ
jgi:mono/diheme cytochrome c family protein